MDAVGKGNSQNPENALFLRGNGGQAGVLDSKNLGLYTYCHQNPMIMVDPDGNQAKRTVPKVGPASDFDLDYKDAMEIKAFANLGSASIRDMFGRSKYYTQAMQSVVMNRRGNGSGITVIGKLFRGEDGGYKQMGKRLNANYLDIPDKVWNKMSESEKQMVNDQFIDYRAQKRDIFRLNISYEEAVIDQGKLGTEVHRLQTKHQYRYDAKTNSLLPPSE